MHFGAINAVLMRFEEKKYINLISKWGCPNLHDLTCLCLVVVLLFFAFGCADN